MLIESPLLKELVEEAERAGSRKVIIGVLVARFGPKARAMRRILNTISDDQKLGELTVLSVRCPDLESFKKQVEPQVRKRR
jgi:hypothetical protein